MRLKRAREGLGTTPNTASVVLTFSEAKKKKSAESSCAAACKIENCFVGMTVSNHWLLQWPLSLQVWEREGCSDYFIWRAQLASVLVFFSHYSCARATPHFQRGHCFFSRHHLYAVAGRARVGEQSWEVRPVARVLGLKHSGDR